MRLLYTRWLIQRVGQRGHGRPIWVKVPQILGQNVPHLAPKCHRFCPYRGVDLVNFRRLCKDTTSTCYIADEAHVILPLQ